MNGDVRALDERDRRCEALAFRGIEILAVGSLEEVTRAAGEGARRWDAGGATVLPGFIDAHHHPSLSALYGGVVRLVPPEVRDIAGLQRALVRASAAVTTSQWVVVTDWDELQLDERRAPTLRELDEAVPDRPLLAMHYSCHRAVANSRALELAGIGRDTPDPAGGAISRGKGGAPDGLLIERGVSRVESLARASLIANDADGFLERLGQHHRNLAAVGITCVVDATVPGDVATLYREALRRRLLLVPTVMFPVSTSGYLEEPWDALDGPRTGERDGLLTVGAIKLVFDGAPVCAMCLGWLQTAGTILGAWAIAIRQRSLDSVRTAMSLKPQIGRKIRAGIHIYGRDEARSIVRAATERGFAVATHAVGNAAIEVALGAYEAMGTSLAGAGIPRIEHGTFLSRDLVTRIANVGAAVVVQPHLLSLPAMSCAPPIPGLRNMATRWLLDAGVTVAGSSDYPVGGYDPLDGIRAAVTRRTNRGAQLDADQCITLDEALVLYTRAAAEVCGCIERTGTLQSGKRADIVILDRALTPGSLADARVRATIIGGEVAFGTVP